MEFGNTPVSYTHLDVYKRQDQIYATWEERIINHPNGIAVLEANMKYQPITINPKDAQLLASRQFNVVDLCRFFSVSPVKAFDLSKSRDVYKRQVKLPGSMRKSINVIN